MTHGVLMIVDGDRVVYLHTYHTEMDIPEAVDGAIDLVAAYYNDVVAVYAGRETPEAAVDVVIKSCNVADRLLYGKSAAAAIIASHPGLLEPLFDCYREDLPTWSGLNSPYKLEITEDRWRLFDEDGTVISDVCVVDELRKRMLAAANGEQTQDG